MYLLSHEGRGESTGGAYNKEGDLGLAGRAIVPGGAVTARMPHSQLPLAPLSDGTVLVRLPRDTDAAAVVEHSRHPDLQATYWLPPLRIPT